MRVASRPTAARRRLLVEGVVQGVGFRPFVRRTAGELGVTGFVLNDGRGVVIEAEGEPATLDRLEAALRERPPSLARVEALAAEELEPLGDREFRIASSTVTATADAAAIPADVATCDECLRELHDPADRRYRYPFVNCTQCGPRFTIVTGVPYDRARTTMARFALCPECRVEYEDPGDRRFHAEPIACPRCGPRLRLEPSEPGGDRDPLSGDEALDAAVSLLRGGAIVAVKGLGGYHLACDASDERAVSRLRARKHREEKPFAVMTSAPELLGELGAAEAALLRSPARPIVLVRRCPAAELPGATDDDEARARLAGIADAFLLHDRPIQRRCEDSVVRPDLPLRRSRGAVPEAISLPLAAPEPIVATGAELKATFCVACGGRAHLSPHLGDLTSELAYTAFLSDLELYLEMLAVDPRLVACDLHPDYLSTRWARERERQGSRVIAVQHHHAHAAACLAENGREGPALALVFDGTGYGPDGTLWGGELLRCDLAAFERLAHLEAVELPGGEAAIREPWRCACAYLEAADRPIPQRWEESWGRVREARKVNAPRSSGMGRLFDAVSALLGVRERVSHEGQAAIELEWLAGDVEADPYECPADNGRIRGAALVAAAHEDLAAGRPRAEIAAAFHEGVALAAARACELAAEPRTVALSGGTFQNLRLLAAVERRLGNLGFEVLRHRQVPPNDGGIGYGQAAIAVRRASE